MVSRLIISWTALALTLVFATTAAWEFGLEETVLNQFGLDHPRESSSEHWRYVLTATGGAALAWSIVGVIFLRNSRGRKKIEHALLESEARLRAIIDHAPANIALKDAEARYLLVNRGHAEQYGVADEEIRGKLASEVFPKAYADAIQQHDRVVLENKRTVTSEYKWARKDGVRTFYIVKFPIPDGAGGIAGIGSISTDITDQKQAEVELRWARDRFEQAVKERTVDLENENAERRRAEKALRENEETLRAQVADLTEAQRKLERQGMDLVRLAENLRVAHNQAQSANRAKSEFLANMSHELRTPLNAVIGFSELIKDEILGPVGSTRYRDYAEDIHVSGRHLLDLINDILDLSKIESGTEELNEEDVRVTGMIGSVLTLVKERAQNGAIELEFDIGQELPVLRADLRKLKQILVNLLANAIKFTPVGGKVTLRARCREDSGHVFQVIDTGIGMRLEDIPKAMAPFQQIDSDLNRKFEGTGLGLPLTRTLAELHGATLELQSQLGSGTTATVRFPAARVVRPDDPLSASVSDAREAR